MTQNYENRIHRWRMQLSAAIWRKKYASPTYFPLIFKRIYIS